MCLPLQKIQKRALWGRWNFCRLPACPLSCSQLLLPCVRPAQLPTASTSCCEASHYSRLPHKCAKISTSMIWMAVDSFQPSGALGLPKTPPFFSPGEDVRNKRTSQDPVLPLFLLSCFVKTESIVTVYTGLLGTKKGAVASWWEGTAWLMWTVFPDSILLIVWLQVDRGVGGLDLVQLHWERR